MADNVKSSEGTLSGNPYGGSKFDWKQYSNSRPKYPPEVFETLYRFHSEGCNTWGAALDVACGPGDGPTAVLAQRFESIICQDRNPIQLDLARQLFSSHPNVTFIEGLAEDLSGVPDSSVDMVSCFTSIHWIDSTLFLREAARVLKPGGTFIIAGYVPLGHAGIPAVDATLHDLEAKATNSAFPLEADLVIGRRYRETTRSHYNNIAIPSDLYTHETRIAWNPVPKEFWTRYSPLEAVDRRNLNGVGFEQLEIPLDAINTVYETPEALVDLLDTMDHFDKQENREAARRVWEILGVDGKLETTRPMEMIMGRRL